MSAERIGFGSRMTKPSSPRPCGRSPMRSRSACDIPDVTNWLKDFRSGPRTPSAAYRDPTTSRAESTICCSTRSRECCEKIATPADSRVSKRRRTRTPSPAPSRGRLDLEAGFLRTRNGYARTMRIRKIPKQMLRTTPRRGFGQSKRKCGFSLPSRREAKEPVIMSAAGAKDPLLTAPEPTVGPHKRSGARGTLGRRPGYRLLVRHPRREFRRAYPDQTDCAFGGVGERVGHERVDALATRVLLEPRLKYRPAASRDPIGLHARQRMSRVAVRVHLVEHSAHDVEVAREGRPRAHHEQPDAVTDVNLQRMLLVLECPPVEHDIARFALERLLPVGLPRERAVAPLHVELALHDDEFLVHLAWPAALRVHDDREIHPLHQVQQHWRRAAVHEIGAGIARGEFERQRVLRQNRPERLVHRDPCGVEVDRVRHRGLVDEANPHQVALAHPDYRAGNGPPEGPALVRHALRDLDRRVAARATGLLHWP